MTSPSSSCGVLSCAVLPVHRGDGPRDQLGRPEQPTHLPENQSFDLPGRDRAHRAGVVAPAARHRRTTPHELCDAALFLIDNPNARSRTLVKNYVPGPDFPTGGVIVDPREAIEEAYVTGRGSFRVRARWKKEDSGRGTYQIVITEIPWLVQKARLIERLAELFNDKKLPLVADFRDESTEDVRVVIEPRARTVDAELLMESLFKLTELESRISLNMNVLVKGKVPKVLGLAEVLREWLDHRREVLVRRSKHRLAEIEHRLEVLGGFLVAYLNLDKVIKIIRNEDEPKPVLIKTFKLSDVQADAILNMRLRNLRKLEEMEIKRENKDLREEKAAVEKLIRSEKEQWKTVAGQIKEVRDAFSKKTPLGKRRTDFAEAPQHDEAAIEEAMVVREPITVVVSEKGWIRALRGHQTDLSGVAFKSDDGPKFSFPAETTSKVLLFATNGRFYTIDASKLPGGRGHGEPVRLYTDIEQDGDLVAAMRYVGGRKFLVGSASGRGFVVKEDDCLANTRKGKQVLNVKAPDKARGGRSGRGRTRRGGRREPQADHFPARSGAGDGARARRAPAAPQGRRAFRRDDVQGGGRAAVDRRGWPHLQSVDQGACRLARQSRRRRPGPAGPFPRQPEVRPPAGERQSLRRQVTDAAGDSQYQSASRQRCFGQRLPGTAIASYSQLG